MLKFKSKKKWVRSIVRDDISKTKVFEILVCDILKLKLSVISEG